MADIPLPSTVNPTLSIVMPGATVRASPIDPVLAVSSVGE
jgi:hypothetical protein